MQFFKTASRKIILFLSIFLLCFVSSVPKVRSTVKELTSSDKAVESVQKSEVDKLNKNAFQMDRKAVDKNSYYDLLNLIIGCLTLFVLFWTLRWVRKYTKVAEKELEIKEFPKVGCLVHREDATLDTWITLKNLSDQIVAVKMDCNISFGNKKINCFDEYNGTKYWNMGPWGSKTGHFHFKDLFQQGNILTKEVIEMHEQHINKEKRITSWSKDDEEKTKNLNTRYIRLLFGSVNKDRFGPEPRLRMFINLTCYRENRNPIQNPIGHYVYEHKKRMIWIPIVTDDSPVWEIPYTSGSRAINKS